MTAQQQLNLRISKPHIGDNEPPKTFRQTLQAAVREVLPVTAIMTLMCGVIVPVLYYLPTYAPTLGVIPVGIGALLQGSLETITLFTMVLFAAEMMTGLLSRTK